MRGPTPKQEAFARAVVAGMNPSEAYRSAYDSGRMSAATVAREAHRLLSHPKIAPIIEEGRREAAEKALWSREEAIERLQAVNDACYRSIAERGDLRRDVTSAFFGSLDRLNELADEAVAADDRPVICMGACRDCQAVGCGRRAAPYDGLGSGERFGR